MYLFNCRNIITLGVLINSLKMDITSSSSSTTASTVSTSTTDSNAVTNTASNSSTGAYYKIKIFQPTSAELNGGIIEYLVNNIEVFDTFVKEGIIIIQEPNDLWESDEHFKNLIPSKLNVYTQVIAFNGLYSKRDLSRRVNWDIQENSNVFEPTEYSKDVFFDNINKRKDYMRSTGQLTYFKNNDEYESNVSNIFFNFFFIFEKSEKLQY